VLIHKTTATRCRSVPAVPSGFRRHVVGKSKLREMSAMSRLDLERVTHSRPFNGPFVRDYLGQPVPDPVLDFTEARDSEWQRHQLGRMQVCTSLQTDIHASTQPLSFLQARRPSCRPTNSVKALKAKERVIASETRLTHCIQRSDLYLFHDRCSLTIWRCIVSVNRL